mgnify:CR=1 FL=1
MDRLLIRKFIILLSASISIFFLRIRYSSLELKKNIIRFSHENIRIFNEFRSIVNMLRALILLTRKCHNIIKHSFNENIKELDYLLMSYWNWNVSTPRIFHTPHFQEPISWAPDTPHSAFSTEPTNRVINSDVNKKKNCLKFHSHISSWNYPEQFWNIILAL